MVFFTNIDTMISLPQYGFWPGILNMVQSTVPLHIPDNIQDDIEAINKAYALATENICIQGEMDEGVEMKPKKKQPPLQQKRKTADDDDDQPSPKDKVLKANKKWQKPLEVVGDKELKRYQDTIYGIMVGNGNHIERN